MDGTTQVVRGRAQAVVVLVGAGLVLYWAFAGAEFWLAAQLSGVRRSAEALDTLRSVTIFQASVAGLYVLVVLAGAVAVGLWVARAHANASALAPGSQRFSRGLAAWCVVIPLANAVLVPMTVADLWRASEPGRRPTPRRPVGAVTAWVACSVASFVVFFGGNVLRAGSRSAGMTGPVVQNVLLVVLGSTGVVLFIRIVRRITGWQEDRTVQPT